uniref:BTB domain-containing protein n=1 Tax=Panagrolaimus sp. ES5 TaxID=591445 RepID=A0AC34EZG8_9BILA
MSDARQNLYEIHMEKYEIFKAQDPETGNFDVVFEIHGKKLYAHKCMLCLASNTFETMLSDRWTNSDESVTIQNYSFNDFKEFLTFLYSGKCQFNHDNIFAMVDIAEFYGVTVLKKACENFLTKNVINLNNVYHMLEIAEKYSMIYLKQSIFIFISNNLLSFLESKHLLLLEKSTLKDIVECVKGTVEQEKLFEAVYKWAENQATKKQKLLKIFDLNDAMKMELTDFLPFIKFEKMSSKFLIEYIVRKSFLFTDEELQRMLWTQNKIFVTVTDENGKIMKGELQCHENDKVAAVIQSMKDISCDLILYCFWPTQQPKPIQPSKIIESESVDWYLVYDGEGDLAVKHRDMLRDRNYLLAEMFAPNGFELSKNCKINVL